MRSLLFLSLTVSGLASADTLSCFPDWTSLQNLSVLDVSQDQHLLLPLDSMNTTGRFETKVVLQADLNAATSMFDLSVHFEETYSGVSLPYNLYAILIIERGEVVAYMDLTKSCTDPGAGIYPGGDVRLPAVQLKGKGREPLQLIVWGRL